jgi:hypothetical protein
MNDFLSDYRLARKYSLPNSVEQSSLDWPRNYFSFTETRLSSPSPQDTRAQFMTLKLFFPLSFPIKFCSYSVYFQNFCHLLKEGRSCPCMKKHWKCR